MLNQPTGRQVLNFELKQLAIFDASHISQWLSGNGLPLQDFLYCGDYFVSFLQDLVVRPSETYSCGDTTVHYLVACRKVFGGMLDNLSFEIRVQGIKHDGIFEMIPFPDIVPVIIVPVKITRHNILGFHFLDDRLGDFLCRQKPAQERTAISRWIGYASERDFRNLF